MVEQLSPLGRHWKPGSHGNFGDGVGVTLSETRPGSIVQVHAWPGRERALREALRGVTGLAAGEPAGAGACDARFACFGIGPRRYLVAAQAEDLMVQMEGTVGEDGVVTDLSHGRTVFRVEGPKAEWVLAKLLAIDFTPASFPEGAGKATMHHDYFVQIQRTGPEQFDLYVFRSFARSAWETLCRAAEPEGYVVK